MQNLQNDNNLDKLSREAAEQFEPDQQLHSWEKLHPHLEAALPQKKERDRRFLLLLLLVLLIGGGVTFSILWNGGEKTKKQLSNSTKDADQSTNAGNEQTTSGNVDQSTVKLDADQPTENKTSTTATPELNNNNNQPQANSPVANAAKLLKNNNTNVNNLVVVTTTTGERNKEVRKPVERNNIAGNNRIIKNDTGNPVNKTYQESTTTINKTVDENKKPGSKEKVSDQKVVTTDKINQNESAIKNDTNDQSQTNKVTDLTEILKNKMPHGNGPAVKPVSTEPPIQIKPEKKKNNQSFSLKKRWEFGLTYAPDVSTVKFTHTQKPGTNLGLTVAYNISNRFAVQTGLIYTTKNYKLRGDDYHPPKHYWTTYVDLKTVSGDCNMWDIPLNLRYNLASKKSSNLFASAGLSSYLMQKEDYNFYYYYNNNPVSRYRSYDTSNKHWFSVLNLSVAYERQLSRTISVQAEPFFKQSLGGIGLGKIKLNSTGIYFSVKYRPLSGQRSR